MWKAACPRLPVSLSPTSSGDSTAGPGLQCLRIKPGRAGKEGAARLLAQVLFPYPACDLGSGPMVPTDQTAC